MIAEVMAVLHLSWNEIIHMDVRWFCKLYSRIPTVDARRMLALMPMHTYPHIAAAKDRTSMYKRLVRQAGVKQGVQDVGAVDVGWAKLRGFSGNSKPEE